jgi:hypothetical protein
MSSKEILTTVEAAELYGTSPSSISRAARKAEVGVRRSDGRLVGISRADLKKAAKHLRYVAGNPNFIKGAKRA